MSGRIKGITIEIGGDTTSLDKKLKGVNQELSSTQNELRDVNKLLKFDPKNTELLKQKQDLLKKAVAETSDKLSALKNAEKDVQKAFAEGKVSEEQYRALKREISETESKLKSLTKASNESTSAMQKIADVAEKVSNKAGQVAQKTKVLSGAAAGLLGSGIALAVKTGQAADDLNTMAQQSGFSTQDIQKFQYAADLIDVDIDTIVKSSAKMTKSMKSTSKDTIAAWKTLGVSLKDQNGEWRLTRDIFYDTVEALSKVKNETERDQLAMQIFGKSANELAGIVDDGGAALRELGNEAEKAGIIMSEDAVNDANEFNDAIDKLKASATKQLAGIGTTIAKDLLPYLEKLSEIISKVLKWFADLSPTLKTIITIILALVAAISPIASIISGVSGAIAIMNAVAAASPITWIVLGIVAAVATLVAIIVVCIEHFDKIKAVAQRCWESIKTGAEWAWYGIKVAAFTYINLIIQYINLMIKSALAPINLLISALNLIPGVSIKKLKFEIAEIKLPDKPKMANGGILRYGGAIVGEAGAEVLTNTPYGPQVTPLNGGAAKNALGGTLGEVVNEIKSFKRIVGQQMNRPQSLKFNDRELGRIIRNNG